MTAPQPLCRHGLPVLDDCPRCDRWDEFCWWLVGWMRASGLWGVYGVNRRLVREEARLEYEEAREDFSGAATEVVATMGRASPGSVALWNALYGLREANDRWQEAQLRRAAVDGGGP